MMALERVPGLGQKLADKLRDHFDGEDAAMAALQSGDISRIAAVNGVSPKRALALARAASGDDGGFLATREAEKLHAQLIEAMRQHAAPRSEGQGDWPLNTCPNQSVPGRTKRSGRPCRLARETPLLEAKVRGVPGHHRRAGR